jgi:hypothetical protein
LHDEKIDRYTSASHNVQNRASSPFSCGSELSGFLQSSLTNKAHRRPPRNQQLDFFFGGCKPRFMVVSLVDEPLRLERPSRELLQVDVGEFVPVALFACWGKFMPSAAAPFFGELVNPSSSFDMIPGSAGFILVHRM